MSKKLESLCPSNAATCSTFGVRSLAAPISGVATLLRDNITATEMVLICPDAEALEKMMVRHFPDMEFVSAKFQRVEVNKSNVQGDSQSPAKKL